MPVFPIQVHLKSKPFASLCLLGYRNWKG